MSEPRSHRDLVVWQKGMELAEQVYRLAKLLPQAEQYRITGQLIRAATSVPANIAEGNARATRKDYANFLSLARGSAVEVETLLLLAVRVQLGTNEDAASGLQLADELSRMLNVMRSRLLEEK